MHMYTGSSVSPEQFQAPCVVQTLPWVTSSIILLYSAYSTYIRYYFPIHDAHISSLSNVNYLKYKVFWLLIKEI